LSKSTPESLKQKHFKESRNQQLEIGPVQFQYYFSFREVGTGNFSENLAQYFGFTVSQKLIVGIPKCFT